MTTPQLGKVERIKRALVGQPVDRPPISFWAHNFARENSVEDLTNETLRQFRLYDWDFIKIQSRAGCFAEGWGNRYATSTDRAIQPKLLEWPIHTVSDLKKIQPLDPERGALGEQLGVLQAVRKEVGPEVPVILTIFAPSMVLTYLLGESPARMLELIRSNPLEAEGALAVIRDTYADYARACLRHGADGGGFWDFRNGRSKPRSLKTHLGVDVGIQDIHQQVDAGVADSHQENSCLYDGVVSGEDS